MCFYNTHFLVANYLFSILKFLWEKPQVLMIGYSDFQSQYVSIIAAITSLLSEDSVLQKTGVFRDFPFLH